MIFRLHQKIVDRCCLAILLPRGLQSAQLFAGGVREDRLNRLLVEQRAHPDELQNPASRNPADPVAAVGLLDQIADPSQLVERLAHGGPTHPEATGELGLGDSVTGPQLPSHDPALTVVPTRWRSSVFVLPPGGSGRRAALVRSPNSAVRLVEPATLCMTYPFASVLRASNLPKPCSKTLWNLRATLHTSPSL